MIVIVAMATVFMNAFIYQLEEVMGGCNSGRGAGESGINNRVVVVAPLMTVIEDFECPCDLHRAAATRRMCTYVPAIRVNLHSLPFYDSSLHFSYALKLP